MMNIQHLLYLADIYRRTLGLEDKTVSSRVFNDSKKLTALRVGSDLTVSRFHDAIHWFDDNWPEGVDWPEQVTRPLTPSRFDEVLDQAAQ